MDVEIVYTTKEEVFFHCVMWKDELETLQEQLMAKENRKETEFAVIPFVTGGSITVDLSEVLAITSNPYVEDENTTIEVEYIDDDYGDF